MFFLAGAGLILFGVLGWIHVDWPETSWVRQAVEIGWESVVLLFMLFLWAGIILVGFEGTINRIFRKPPR